MKIKFKLLIMGLLSSIFGFSQNTKNDIFPKDNFSIVEGTTESNKPIIGSINMAYKNYDEKAKYPWCLKISIGLDLDKINENGLPKVEESAIANKLEDELLNAIKKITTTHYIGHLFNDTFLDIYIYLDEPSKVHQYLQTQINKEGLIRGFGYEIIEDPNWETFKSFIK